jgi:hypothetical protein
MNGSSQREFFVVHGFHVKFSYNGLELMQSWARAVAYIVPEFDEQT